MRPRAERYILLNPGCPGLDDDPHILPTRWSNIPRSDTMNAPRADEQLYCSRWQIFPHILPRLVQPITVSRRSWVSSLRTCLNPACRFTLIITYKSKSCQALGHPINVYFPFINSQLLAFNYRRPMCSVFHTTTWLNIRLIPSDRWNSQLPC